MECRPIYLAARCALLAATTLLQSYFAIAANKQAPAAGNGASHPELLVSTQWLADHLSDPHLVIVHIGHDRGDYQAAHIPGARFPVDGQVRKRPRPRCGVVAGRTTQAKSRSNRNR